MRHLFRFTTCALAMRGRAATLPAHSRRCVLPVRGGGARLLMAAAALKTPPCRITYVTDVEGALDYWERFTELSEVLERDAAGELVPSAPAACLRGEPKLSAARPFLVFLSRF